MNEADPHLPTGRGDRAAAIFDRALALSDAEREAFLDAQCAGDAALRAELASMLQAHAQAAGFLEPRSEDQAAGRTAESVHRAGETIGRYELLETIGEGGFGIVFRAQQREPVRRQVALKVIKLGMDTRAVIARFEAERQALAMMDHPAIAKVFDAGSTAAGRPYFVMELVHGVPITEYCDAQHLNTGERLRLFIHVCHAVQHAHQKGIIHRDIKPSNVLVTTQDGTAAPKVIDFGIAKATNAEQLERTVFTEMRQFVGTPTYMSPEQAGATTADVDTRSDIYSLGVLLYELLAGTTPFDARKLLGAGFDEMMRVIREEEPVRPSTRFSTLGAAGTQVAECRRADTRKLRTLLRGDLDWITMKCLEKDRSRRYATASALAEDIQRHLDDEPVTAGPPSAVYRWRKFARRYRAAVAAGSVVALVLIAATSVSIAFAWREARARQREQVALAREVEQRRRADQEAERATLHASAAEAARQLAEKRADETRQVADFQAEMLRGLDAQAVGGGIRREFRETLRATLGRQQIGEWPNRRPRTSEEIETELAGFDRTAGSVEMADVARRVLDQSLLAVAASTVEQKFADQPLVQAEIRDALAAAYRALGLYDPAEQQARAALAIREHELGRESVEVAANLNRLAMILNDNGKFAEAAGLCGEALAIQRRLLGEEHADVAESLHALGVLHHQMGDLAAAERFYQDALAMRRKLLGARHPDVATNLNSLATLTAAKDDFDTAEAMLREALEIQQARLEEGHPDTITTMRDLAVVLGDHGKSDECIALNRQALGLARARLGNEHSDVAGILSNLGIHLKRKGESAEAETMYREALEARRKALRNDHPDLAQTLNNLAVLLRDRGDYAAAEPLFREAIAIQEKAFPPGHELRAVTRASLGHTLAKLAMEPDVSPEVREGHLAEAEALLLQADEDFSKLPHPNAFFVRRVLEWLSELYEVRHLIDPSQGYEARAAAYRSRLDQLQPRP